MTKQSASTTAPSTAQDVPAARIVAVDPATASRWLHHNGANRKIRDTQINKYAADMSAGRWALTGAPIQFSVDGTLLDGQHRLKAVVESGVTIPMFVVEGLPVGAQPYMDVGMKRTLSDQLSVLGYLHTPVLAAGAKIALAWSTDRLSDHLDAISDAEVREFIDATPALLDAAEFAAGIKCQIRPSVVCATVWRLEDIGHDSARVHEFFAAISEMRSDGPGDPKYALLHRISTARSRRERLKNTVILSMLVRCYNADYGGQQLHRMHAFRAGSNVGVPAIVSPITQAPVARD